MNSGPQNRFVLRPLELKHLFDFAIRLLRFNFLPMFLSMAMVQLPVALLSIPMTIRFVAMAEKFQDPAFLESSGSGIFNSLLLEFGDTMMMSAMGLLLIAVYQLLVMPLGLLTSARLAARALDGHRDSFSEAFSFALSRYWATQVALATYFLPTVVLSLVVLLFVLASIQLGGGGATVMVSATGIFLIFAAVIATMLLYFRFFPALSGVLQASEDSPEEGILPQGVWFLRRSFGLTQGHYLRVLGLMFLLAIAANVIQSGMRSTIEMLVALFDYMSSGIGDIGEYFIMQAEGTTDPMQLGISMVLLTLLMLIFPPYWQCFKLLLYVDLRCRKEAFDIYRLLEEDRLERSPMPGPNAGNS